MLKIFSIAFGTLVTIIIAPIIQPRAAAYTFNVTGVVTSDPLASNSSPSFFPAVSILIQDTAVQSGSFAATYIGSPANFRGDYASLISFNIGNVTTVMPTVGDASTFRANLLFGMDGSVSAGALFYSGDSFGIDLAGTASLFQGAFTGSGGQGFVSGTLTAVPEPTSIVLMIAGIFGLALIRQRARWLSEKQHGWRGEAIQS